jgi:AraC family transcriptional regulator of adaptative response/methylated-DNA-[protein]-cysteine methyltransferase
MPQTVFHRQWECKENAMNPSTIQYAIGISSLGRMLVARSPQGLCAILLADEDHLLEAEIRSVFAHASLQRDDEALGALLAEVAAFVDSPGRGFGLPLDAGGTPFQRRVWEALRAIPAGTTVTYTDIAQGIGLPNAVRAVASACAANRLAVAIPCHRVVRRGGALSGYRWGIGRKRQLLAREALGACAASCRAGS